MQASLNTHIINCWNRSAITCFFWQTLQDSVFPHKHIITTDIVDYVECLKLGKMFRDHTISTWRLVLVIRRYCYFPCCLTVYYYVEFCNQFFLIRCTFHSYSLLLHSSLIRMSYVYTLSTFKVLIQCCFLFQF